MVGHQCMGRLIAVAESEGDPAGSFLLFSAFYYKSI